jgi:hypothetical protein
MEVFDGSSINAQGGFFGDQSIYFVLNQGQRQAPRVSCVQYTHAPCSQCAYRPELAAGQTLLTACRLCGAIGLADWPFVCRALGVGSWLAWHVHRREEATRCASFPRIRGCWRAKGQNHPKVACAWECYPHLRRDARGYQRYQYTDG